MVKKIIILAILAFFLLSYRITDTPMGLTADEAAFGWNAILLSRTGYDQNGRHLPVFVNSLNQKDWRQPWTQYYLAIFYKVFGASIYNLRVSSVVLVIATGLLLFIIASKLLNPTFASISFILFVTTPIIFMHSHLGLDNVMPLPFIMIWALSLYLYSSKSLPKYLLISGLALGSSFYAYKGMRAVVPVWSLLTIYYLYTLSPKTNLAQLSKKIIWFVVGILPFFLIIPYLSQQYPGSIFGGARPKFSNIYDFFYPYLSHYDLTFMFIKGDDLLFHSTRIHGMYLLSTLPIFLIGLYQSIKKGKYWHFVLMAFFSGPVLYGLVDSSHRASRIIAIVPFYILITTLGIYHLNQQLKFSKIILSLIAIVIGLNFFDFANYYWFTYPKFTENIFGNLKSNQTYKEFSFLSHKLNLKPYVNEAVFDEYIDLIYFPTYSEKIQRDGYPPSKSIYLTYQDEVPGMKKATVDIPLFHIFIPDDY